MQLIGSGLIPGPWQAPGSGQRPCGVASLQMSSTARLDTRQSRAARLCNQLVDRSWTVTYPCTVPLCNGLAGYTWGWSLRYPNVQWAGRLCIGVEFRLSGCTTGLLIMAGYTSGQLSGCATGQVNLVRLHIRIARSLPGCVAGRSV